MVEAFAQATGDRSAIHLDAEFARRTRFRRPIVHGMLPVLAVMREASHSRTGNSLWLRQFSCKFLAPAHIGDRLRLTWREESDRAGGVRCVFNIADESGNVAVSEGEGVFSAGPARTSPSPTVNLVSGPPVVESVLGADSITLGRSETIGFCAAPAGVRKLLTAIDARCEPPSETDWVSFDPNLASLLPVSTLVGMRLPGRLATFMGLEVAFDRAIQADSEILLKGAVERIMPGRNRLRLSLEWAHAGTLVASGTASTIVNAAGPVGIGCDEIRSRHLSTGIEGRVALVTGASRGIGEAIAKLLAMHGAKVAVHYFRGGADAAAVVADIRRHGGTALAVSADLRREAEIEAAFAAVRANLGEVDILVNNAVGSFSPKPFDGLESIDYLDEMEVSLFGMHACCRRATPHMRAQRWGKVVNISTIATETPVAQQSVYITAKSAAIGYTRSLAQELAGENVQVNMVLPRMTDTSLIASLPSALLSRLAGESPTGKLLEPVDVAKTVAFLASDAAASISGQRIVLSQGDAPFL